MYKNQTMFRSSIRSSIIFLAVGVPLSLFSLLGICGMIFEDEVDYFIVLPLLIFIGSIIMIITAIKTFRLRTIASYVAGVLEKDSDGYVSMDKVLKGKGKRNGSSYERQIVKAHAKGFFIKISYNSSARVFYLSDRITDQVDYEKRFVGINCPNCGAPLKIREGSSQFCSSCGSEVRVS